MRINGGMQWRNAMAECNGEMQGRNANFNERILNHLIAYTHEEASRKSCILNQVFERLKP